MSGVNPMCKVGEKTYVNILTRTRLESLFNGNGYTMGMSSLFMPLFANYKALELHAHFFLFAQDFQTQWKWEKIGNHFSSKLEMRPKCTIYVIKVFNC